MSHPSDKDLDRLSREAAEQYDVEQDTSGWEQLQERLDKELPPGEDKDRRRFLWLLLLVTGLSGTGLVWILAGTNTTASSTGLSALADKPAQHAAAAPVKDQANNNRSETVNTKPGTQAAPQYPSSGGTKEIAGNDGSTSSTSTSDNNNRQHIADPLASTKAVQPESKRISGNREHTAGEQASSTKVVNGKRRDHMHEYEHRNEIAIAPVLTRRRKAGRKPVNRTSRSNELATARKKQQQHDAKGDADEQSALTQNNHNSDDHTKTGEPKNINKDSASPASQNNAPVAADSLNKSNNTVSNTPDSSATTAVKKPLSKKQTPQRGWEIGLLAGPDVSNIAFRNANKTGYNFGIQLGYRFSKRLSVNAGLIYTKKNYNAKAKDYHPSKPYWYSGYQLDDVEGYCQMLDIPVNIRYNLTTDTKATWFVSTGLSSYLMKKQYYDYNTHNITTGAPHVYGWSYGKDSSYLFSILNLSAGWERSLNKHFSIQAEPYLKIPLKGLGYGKMMINSYGLLLSVKYKPTFHPAKR